ncbi:MAG: DUF169 domain-containing protein [Desulfobacterales bacterium]|jgi:hypothetical protein
MNTPILKALPQFLETLGLDEEPMGIFYTDEQPAEGFSPKPNELPTREKEIKNEINWQEVFGQFSEHEVPELVAFFTRPESLSGLHQLAAFVTNDPEVVVSPWGAGCGNVVVWPLHYLSKGDNKAVVGGWDPSARKFFKTDELSFTVPFKMFVQMVERFNETFLTTKSWATVQKKIERSKKIWGEG